MANNHSQLYYGFPHGYPPPQMHQPPPAQPEEQGGAPPLQQLPGISFTSYAQNSQQPPFPAPAWPPQLPPDANLWALFQNGTFPPPNLPPPPFPGMGFPPPSLPQTPQTPQNLAMPAHFPPPFPHRPAHAPAPASAPTSERIQDIMDSDREDGELSEADAIPQPPPSFRANSGPHPTSSARYNDRNDRAQAQQEEPRVALQDRLQQDRESARQFVKLLHSNNIPYRTLADEKLDAELLRGLYQSVNLPSEPAPILPPKTNGAASNAPAVQPVTTPQQNTLPAIKTSINPAPSAKSAASPTAPVDRKDYIARLQAARAAKQAGSSKPASPSQQTAPAKPIIPAPTTKTPQPAATPAAKPPVTDEQRARNTELIKQRLEAIKARQKAPGGVNIGGTQRAEQSNAAGPAASGLTTPMNQSYVPSFSGIPGLFMNNTPASSTAAPLASQKPPTPKNDASASRESTTPYTRPLGQSPHSHQEDDSMIIEVSEDESNGSDMDIEDDPSNPETAQTPRQNFDNLPNFPQAGSTPSAAPAVSAPGAQTPTTVAREKELVDKEKQLVAMRETLKKKLAEKRERDRLASAAAASSPSAQKSSTPVLLQSHTPMMESTRSSPMPARHTPIEPARSSVNAGKDNARQRRAEIQSRLPTLDAEIANNASRMAQLTKEMEELTAQNERIARDKEQLTQELESLGVDTEGMSHAELRAKKDEIEREQSPDPNVSSQNANSAPQSTENDPSATVQSSLEASGSSAVENEKAIFSVPLPASSQLPERPVALPGLGQNTSQPQSQLVGGGPDQFQMPAMGSKVNGTTNAIEQDESQSISNTEAAATNGTMASDPQSPVAASNRDADEDHYSPQPPTEDNLDVNPGVAATSLFTSESATQSAAAPSPSEEGEVEMSVSEGEDGEEEEEYEPEYDPEEHVVVADVPAEANQKAQPEAAPSGSASQISTEDEDEEAYEPPDVDQEMPDVQNKEVAASDGIPHAQAEADDGAMDIATSSDDSSGDSDSDDESTSGSDMENTISANNSSHQNTNIADDLAPELQPMTAPAAVATEQVPVSEEKDQPAAFTPYQSPLRMFKSYRYHPSYAQDVSGGFLSLTFSHQIDPVKPFCQYESAGGACNDPECPDQHFRDATITGDKLLVQLGTANPGKTSEEKQRWNDGLRGVLKELRQKNIKDPNGIAVEIARYRRQFLNDDTRVVNL